MSFNITVENAQGMTHDEVGNITRTIEARGIDLHAVKTLILDRREGWVGIVFRDGREAVMTEVIEVVGGRKVFLPNEVKVRP